MKRFLPFILLLFITLNSIAQSTSTITPAQTLRLARATYEQGRLHEIAQQLNEDVIAKMNQAEKVEAYKLLCLSYIYLEEPEQADAAMLNILLTNSYFEINENIDPAEFVALYKTFRTRPIYRIGAKLGVDASQPNIKETATAAELAPGSKYSPLVGILFGISVDKPVNTKLTLHADLLFTQKRFRLNQVFERQDDVITQEPLQNKTEAIEQQTWLSLPITVEYNPFKVNSNFHKKFAPYIGGGVSVDYLLKAEITGEQTRDQQSAIQEKTFDIERNKVNVSLVGVIGTKIRVGGGYIVGEFRYLYGVTKVNSKENAYANQELTWELNYADPIFKVSSLQVSVAYIQNIFKPKKLSRRK